jgi:cytoskeletal protein CcmA (bactofilin family)
MIPNYRKVGLLMALAVPFFLGAFSASAHLLQVLPEMGDLERWGAFSLGGGITDTTKADDLDGNTFIKGDVGVAGSGNITMSGNATINGNLYYRTNGTLSMSGNATITGSRFHNASSNSILDNGVNEAINASNHAFALPVNRSFTSFTGNQNRTITGAPGETVVMKLTNFTLTGGTFTLSGTATTNFIINVTNQFSLSGQAKIVLSGGVTWDNVLFNIRGSGSNVTLSDQSRLSGILMANNRTVQLSGQSIVTGEVVANKLSVSGKGQIIHPPITSP